MKNFTRSALVTAATLTIACSYADDLFIYENGGLAKYDSVTGSVLNPSLVLTGSNGTSESAHITNAGTFYEALPDGQGWNRQLVSYNLTSANPTRPAPILAPDNNSLIDPSVILTADSWVTTTLPDQNGNLVLMTALKGIARYNATTGVRDLSWGSDIGLWATRAAYDGNGHYLFGFNNSGGIGRINAATGTLESASFIDTTMLGDVKNTRAVAVSPSGQVYIAATRLRQDGLKEGVVAVFDQNGAVVNPNLIVTPAGTSAYAIESLALDNHGNLFISTPSGGGETSKYNATTGALISAGFANGYVVNGLTSAGSVPTTTNSIIGNWRTYDRPFVGNQVITIMNAATVTADNPGFSGSFIVTDGSTFYLGNGGSTGTLGTASVELQGASTLSIDRTNSLSVLGQIKGEGFIHVHGGGTVTISNAADFTGSYTVYGNSHLILPINQLQSWGQVESGSTLELVSQTGMVSLIPSVQGEGRLLLSGTGVVKAPNPMALSYSSGPIGYGYTEVSGSVILDLGTNPDQGKPTQDNPSINLAQPFAGRLEIDSGARVQGQGYINGSIINRGTIAPGNSPGIITTTGDFTNTGTIEIEVAGNGVAGAPDGFDQIRYAGTATLGGTLHLNEIAGYRATGVQQVRFLLDTTPGATPQVTGSFASIVTPAGTLASISTDANGVVLTYAYTDKLVRAEGLRAFASQLSQLSQTPAASALLNTYATSGATAARQAVVNASPISLGALTSLPLNQASGSAEIIRTRLDERRLTTANANPKRKYQAEWSAYATGTGDFGRSEDTVESATFDRNSVGGKVGLERDISSELCAGFNFGYDTGRATFHNSGGKASQEHVNASVYGSWSITRDAFLYLGAFAGRSAYDTERDTLIGRNSGDTKGMDYGTAVYLGHRIRADKDFDLTPYAGLIYSRAQVDGFTESGNSLAYAVDDYAQNSLRLKFGTDADWTVPIASVWTRLGFGLSLEHELLDHEAEIDAGFASGGTSKFTTTSNTLPVNTVNVGPHASVSLGNAGMISASYTLRYGASDETAHRINLTYSKKF